MTPRVSIVVLSYFHPEVVDVCLRTLEITEGDYEVVVVDNGSDQATVAELREHHSAGKITTLVELPENRYFSGGNNAGVAATDLGSEVILLLNSDVGFLRSDWLAKALAWLDGTAVYEPSVWGLKPTIVKPGPLDVVSVGWSHDASVQPSMARPEGWCCLFRRSVWRDLSTDFPWYYGFEEMVANVIRDGARCGVLSQYSPYLVHMEGASGKEAPSQAVNLRTPDIAGWFAGLDVETLDFTLGPDEHQSYLTW